MPTQITHGDATFFFSANVDSGTFVNGEPYVIGPVSITNITPNPTTFTGRAGSMKNQTPEGDQGYDSTLQRYNAAVNASLSFPIALAAGDSLTTSVPWDPPIIATSVHIKQYVTLTVLASHPASAAFRPSPYGGSSARSTLHYLSSRDLSSLQSFTPTASAKTKAVIDATLPALPWIEMGRNFFDNTLLAIDNFGSSSPGYPTHYGGDVISKWSKVAMFLQLNHSLADKDHAINQTIQCGLDIMEYFKNGGVLEMSISHKQGRGFPVYFAAVVMGDADCQGIVNHPGILAENRATWQVAESDVGRAVNSPKSTYSAIHVGMYEWGQEHYSKPYLDDSDWKAPVDNSPLNAYDGMPAPTIRESASEYRYNYSDHGGTYFAILAMDPDAWGHAPFKGYVKRFKGVTGWYGGEADELFAAYGAQVNTEKPTILPIDGQPVEAGRTISMSSNTGGAIYYTTDGSTPDNTKTVYAAPIARTETIKAVTVNGAVTSGVSVRNYTLITNGTPAPPTNIQFVP